MLPGPGFSDDPAFPHAPGKERLPHRVVDLVRAGVVEVFALEPDRCSDLLAEARRGGEWGRSPDIVGQEIIQFRAKGRIGHRRVERHLELVERGDEGLRHVPAAENSKAILQ